MSKLKLTEDPQNLQTFFEDHKH